ncbi:34237_t:CDS:2, partial [Racocetra persica]
TTTTTTNVATSSDSTTVCSVSIADIAILRTEAKDLPCLFNFFAEDYPGNAPMVENKAKGLVKYLSKLSPLLEKVGDSVFYVPIKKTKKKVLSDNEINFCNSGIQVSLPEYSCDFGIQVLLPNPEYENSLLNYSPSQWLMMHNPVVVEFIKTLTYNENEDHYEGEKLFKCAVAIDNIYGIKYLKYVSSINLALLAIKYSIAKSKTIIDIDSYIINTGSFTKFINWQETLAGNSDPFPNGLVFIAFDNEQKGQKNYLDHGYNKVIFHTVTKKNEEINVIDDLITNQSAKTKNQKQCHDCGKKDIENSKRKCPQYHAKLLTLAETQQEKEQTISDKKEKNSIKPLTFRPYQPKESKSGKSNESTSSISITQNLEPQD